MVRNVSVTREDKRIDPIAGLTGRWHSSRFDGDGSTVIAPPPFPLAKDPSLLWLVASNIISGAMPVISREPEEKDARC